MINASQIKPHMPVVGTNDVELGKVDHVDGKCLKLTKDATGQHHYIPLAWVKNVDEKVHVDRAREDVMKSWSTSPITGDAE